MAAKKIKKIFIGGRAKPLPRQGLCDLSGRKLRGAILNLGGLDLTPLPHLKKGWCTALPHTSPWTGPAGRTLKVKFSYWINRMASHGADLVAFAIGAVRAEPPIFLLFCALYS